MSDMQTSPEHRADCAVLAWLRDKEHRPRWDERIDVSSFFHDSALTFEEIRDRCVDAVKASRWYRRSDEFDTLRELVEELGEVDGNDEFNWVWNAIYDEADLGEWRVWINTF